jgi:hypothetical protein
MRARNWRCAEVGVNCGEPQNGAGGSMVNYRNWKEIGALEGEWGECERQITPVENMDCSTWNRRLERVARQHCSTWNNPLTLTGALADGEDHLVRIGQTNRFHPLELMGQPLVGGRRSLSREQHQVPLSHA